MITKIITKDLRGHSLDVELDRFTVIGGPHGSGKTSLAMAANLALLGYYPGDDKKGAAIMDNCAGDDLGCAVMIDGHTIGRRWSRSDKGSVSETVKVDGIKAAGKGADGMIRLALGGSSRIFDGVSFWGLSDRETRKAILRLTAGDKADELLDMDAKPREKLNAARAARQAAEKALAATVAGLTDIPFVAGNIKDIKARVAADRETLDGIMERIAQGDQADQERKRLLSCIALWDKSREAEQDEMRREWAVLEKGNPVPRPTVPDAIAPLPGWARMVIHSIIRRFDGCEGTAAQVYDEIKQILMTEAQNEAAVAAAKQAVDQWEAEDRQIGSKRVTVSRRIGELNRMGTEARTAMGRLDKLPPSPSAEDRKAADGLQERIRLANMQIEAATRRAQVDEMAEKQRQAVEMLTQAEEKAKSELNSAAVQMSQALADGCVELAERAGQILPDGNLAIIATEERTRLGWNRDGIGVVMRNCLSGSERVIFDAAVAYALLGEGCTAFLDAGECGNDRLEALAPIAARCKCQLVLFRWTDSKTKLPKMNGWKTIELQ